MFRATTMASDAAVRGIIPYVTLDASPRLGSPRYSFCRPIQRDHAAYTRIIDHLARVSENVEIDGERYFYLSDVGTNVNRAIKESDVYTWAITDMPPSMVRVKVSPANIQKWIIHDDQTVTSVKPYPAGRTLKMLTHADRDGNAWDDMFQGFLDAAEQPAAAGIRAGFLDAC